MSDDKRAFQPAGWRAIEGKLKPRIGEKCRLRHVRYEEGPAAYVEFWWEGWTLTGQSGGALHFDHPEHGQMPVQVAASKQAVQFWYDERARYEADRDAAPAPMDKRPSAAKEESP